MKYILYITVISVVLLSLVSLSKSQFNKNIVSASNLYNGFTEILVFNPWNSNQSNLDIVVNATVNLNAPIVNIISYDEQANTIILIAGYGDMSLVQVDLDTKEITLYGSLSVDLTYLNSPQPFQFIDKIAYLPIVVPNQGFTSFYSGLLELDYLSQQSSFINFTLLDILTEQSPTIQQGYDSSSDLMYSTYQTIENSTNLFTFKLSKPDQDVKLYQSVENISQSVDMLFVDSSSQVYILYDNTTTPAPSVIEFSLCKVSFKSSDGSAKCSSPLFAKSIGYYNGQVNRYIPTILSQDKSQFLLISREGLNTQTLVTFEVISLINDQYESKQISVPNVWMENQYSYFTF